jgi:hypothetical protein
MLNNAILVYTEESDILEKMKFCPITTVRSAKPKRRFGFLWSIENRKRNKMVICITEAFTKKAEIAAINNKAADTVAEAIG